MFNKTVGIMLATLAAADINHDYEGLLAGDEQLRGTDMQPMWEQFKNEFAELSPVDLSEQSTMYTFFENVDRVIDHNSKDDKTYTKEINLFSAMTFEQFSEHFNMAQNQANAPQNCSATRSSPLTAVGVDDAPDAWNWQNKGGVSPVKDQGQCGSCWTFSTVGCLESAHLIKYGVLQTYAEQQLVDCAGDFDNFGCNGGLPSHAFEYIFSAGGIETEEDYPYMAVDQTCAVDTTKFALSSGHSMNITEGDEEELKQAVFLQPVSVAFQVADDFVDISTGVYTSTVCQNGPDQVNHAVLAVGYGNDKASGLDYWLIKNSWGTTWGDAGFFKIQRGVNMCGIADCNSYPESVAEIGEYFQFMQ